MVVMIERSNQSQTSGGAMKIKPSRAAAMVDKNSRTIVKIMQLQEYLADNEKEYTAKDRAVLRRIGNLS